MMFTAKVKGIFIETQSVEAKSAKEAELMFKKDMGETLERHALEISSIEEIEEVIDGSDMSDADLFGLQGSLDDFEEDEELETI